MALTAEEFEGQSVKSLKTLVAKQIGVPDSGNDGSAKIILNWVKMLL